jgi:hypothetical protein
MIVPTAINLKMKFPEFQGIADAQVEFAIEEASLFVDDSWLPDTQTLGILYLAAHYLMVEIMRAQSATGQVITSERMGEMSVTYAGMQPFTEATSSDWMTTLYGMRFREFAHINNPPIAII